ncbi:MAG: FadR/GntR family transcriptional regulator [Myxococcales bacterium]|nr:FadR family transcriptional regulator [Myxococcota bacterium]MDW8280620.1 FadR/GntR family transcriptional regulator [Myxococcales bacterium]
MLKPIGKQRVAEEIVHQLRGLILRGHYATGDKLPPERKLAEELGVNRASLREAIKSLEQMGLVKTRQGDGTRVLDFMQTAGVELVSHLVAGSDGAPSLDVLDDVLEFRRIFARDVARLAAHKATPQDIDRLEEVARRAEDPELSHEELLKVDFEFYIELTRAAKNRVFQLLINTIRAAVMSHAAFFTQLSQPPAIIRKHHREVIEALRARDAERAAEAVDQYLSKGQELLATLFPAHKSNPSNGGTTANTAG